MAAILSVNCQQRGSLATSRSKTRQTTIFSFLVGFPLIHYFFIGKSSVIPIPKLITSWIHFFTEFLEYFLRFERVADFIRARAMLPTPFHVNVNSSQIICNFRFQFNHVFENPIMSRAMMCYNILLLV
jgi:hypothetical protein